MTEPDGYAIEIEIVGVYLDEDGVSWKDYEEIGTFSTSEIMSGNTAEEIYYKLVHNMMKLEEKKTLGEYIQASKVLNGARRVGRGLLSLFGK